MTPEQDEWTAPTNRVDELLAPEMVQQLSASSETRATGFMPLDGALAGGFAPEELVIVGGRPGVGKSIVLAQWASNLAKAGRNVVMAYYEHSELVLLAQLLLIEVGQSGLRSVDTIEARELVGSIVAGRTSWTQAIDSNDVLGAAAERMGTYAANLRILDRDGRRSGLGGLADSVHPGATDVLMVDHLQKVMDGHVVGSAGITARFCKTLAVDTGATVIASTVVENEGLDARRLRMGQLVDSATIAHEADIEIVLNDKLPMVSRNHTAFDSVRADSFRNQVIFSVEKNRRGLSGLNMEFNRDFAHRRFEPAGGFVSEHLIDDVTVLE